MAISLPSVVGDAVCPCVRASIATSACSSASAATAAITCAAAVLETREEKQASPRLLARAQALAGLVAVVAT